MVTSRPARGWLLFLTLRGDRVVARLRFLRFRSRLLERLLTVLLDLRLALRGHRGELRLLAVQLLFLLRELRLALCLSRRGTFHRFVLARLGFAVGLALRFFLRAR